MKNIKFALAAACAVVVGWAFTASARSVSLSSDNGAIEVSVGADAETAASTLYLAWGETDEGDALADWANRVKVGDVTAVGGTFNVDGRALAIPLGAKIRAFVTKPGYELLEYIGSSGTQYVDTGIVGAFGDVYEVKFAVTAYTGGSSAMHILSEYDASKGNDYGRYQVICRDASGRLGQGFESNGSNSSADPCIYASFTTSLNVFYTVVSDFTKGGRAFEVYNADKTSLHKSIGTTTVVHQTIYNPSGYTLYLFAANSGGTAAAMERGNTRVAYVKLTRGGSVVKHLVAARRGDSVGMVDLADGCRFYPNAGDGSFECGAVTGEIPGETLVASPAEDYSGYELPAGVVAVESDADGKIVVSVGADVVQSAGSLFLAWDETDRGGAVSDWAHRAYLGDVTASGGFVVTNGCDLAIPSGAKIRAFVTERGYELLEYIGSSGTQYIDTGIVGALGDVYEVKLAVTAYTSSSSMHVLSEYDSSKGDDYGRYQVVCRDSKGRLGQGFESNGSSASADPNLFAGYVTSLNVFYTVVSDFTKGARAFEVYNADKTLLHTSASTTRVVHQEVYNPNGYTLYLFAANHGGTAAAMERGNTRVAYVKLTRGGSVVKHLVAARRGDSVGMVDLADGCRFYPNAGDGSFECGTVVETLPGDGIASSAAVGYDGPEPPSPPPEEPEDPEEAEWANLFPANVRHICVVAPCSQHPASTYLAAKAKLEEAGYTVTLSPEVTNGNGTSEMTPAQKAEHFMRAWTNEDYDVIWAIRGGNGGAQTFAQLDPVVLRSREVPFLGFSNISCLLNPMEKLGVRQLISGPSLGALYSYHTPKASRDLICKLVGKEPISTNVQLTVQRALAKTVTGKPLGGHWPSLSACNAEDLPDCTGRIVFLEVNEYSYADATAKFDVLHGKWNLDDAAAIVVGEVLTTSQRAETLQYVVDHVTCPVYSGYPMGHQKEVEFFPVDFGRDMTLTPDGVITYEDLVPAGISASAYIQDGLVAQWDGIENAGAGQPHDATLAEWKDASGTHSFVFNANSGITVEDSALVFPGSQAGYATLSAADTDATFEAAKNGTCEVVVLSDANTVANMALQSSAQSGICLFARARSSATAEAEILTTTGASDASKRTPVLCNLSSAITTMATTYSSALADDTWANGELLKKSGASGYGTNPNDKTYLGHRASLVSGQSFKGRIYAIRLYSRPLTESEIAINANIDKIRFVDANPAELTWPDGYRWNADQHVFEVLLTLSGVGGATVSFDNETFATATNGWFALGTSVTAYAKPAIGQTIASWTGLPDGAQVSDDKTTATFALTAPMSVAAVSHGPTTLRWRGTKSAFASDMANWAKDDGSAAVLPPQNGDAVHFDKDSPSMTWDLDEVTLASWTQDEDFTGTNTFLTGPIHEGVDSPTHGVLSADGKRRELIVTGDITLNGGTWKGEANPSMNSAHPGWTSGEGVYRLIARAGGDFSVAESVTVVANNGFKSGQGPGYRAGCGACHGGAGGGIWAGATDYISLPYGKVREPVTIGSAGGSSVGGGAIEVSAKGSFALNGTLNASAVTPTDWYSAAGGSVYLSAGYLTGSGSVLAQPTVPKNGSCGGGGRIALVLSGIGATFDGFTGTLDCRGRTVTSHSGTIYKETPADREDGGVLEIRGSGSTDTGSRGLYTLLQDNGEDYHFANIILSNKVLLAIGPNTTVATKRLETYGTANVISMVGGTLVVPNGYAFADVTLRSEFNPSTITTPDGAEGTNVLANGVTFTMEPEVTFGGTLVMRFGSKITHTANGGTDVGYRANFNAENLIVENGASVTLAGKGFSSAKGPGRPQDENKTDRSGSHGGLAVDVGSVKAYGSITRPVTLGSGGKSAAGAGATHIKVKHAAVIDGSISASASDWYYSGAAGSVWLETGTLKGASTGAIVANGWHQGTGNYYGGGGGRIAVTLKDDGADFSGFLGKIQANGVRYDNAGTWFSSGNGTVYLRQNGEAENEGTLVVDGVTGSFGNSDNYTDITDEMTECLVGHVVITNSGNLRVRKGAELHVRKSFRNVSRYRAKLVNGEAGDDDHAPGAVAFVDKSVDALITGTNVFMCLKSAEPGKTVRFGAATGTLTGVAAGGVLSIAGEQGKPVYLRGLADDTAWLFDFHGKTDVAYADVRDSDASMGDKVSVDDTNIDSGSNLNWGFVGIKVGDTNVWRGTLGSAWAAADNWSLGRAPVDTDVIVIPAEAACSPEITEALTLNRLEIAADKSLTLNGFSLTVTNGVDCLGSVVCTGSEVVTLDGDVVLKGFTPANSTLVLADTRTRTVDLGGQAFRRISVSGTAPTIEFTDGFAADFLTVACDASAFEVVFASGRTVTVGELVMQGVIGDGLAGLTLSSGTPGEAWNLKVTGKGSGSGLIVNDSHAIGQQVFAYDPSTCGNNVTGWIFGITEATWTGGASGDWGNPENWSGNAVPGADSCVHFTSDATVTLDVDDATAKIFDVANCTVNLKGSKTLTVKSLFEILDGGTLNQASSGNVVRVEGAAFVRSGGVWTHAMNGTADASWKVDNGYGINGVVNGDLVVEAGGKITAYGKGYHYGYGPGCMSGSSHGGRWFTNGASKPCYGSMFTPDLLGSGGANSSAASGGGRVRLVVGGKLTVDGSIDAQGETQGFYNASGGSVWVTCGSLVGSGEVQANGANKSSYYDTGCGGRVAVYQTVATDFDGFNAGKITAYGGVTTGVAGAYPERPAGTVYLQSAGDEDRCGTVFVRNNQSSAVVEVGGVDLPVTNLCPETVKSYRDTTFDLSKGGIMTIVADVTIKELELTSAARLNLDGHTLTIRSHKHKKRKGWPTTWGQKCGIFPGADADGNPGKIVWEPYGLMIMVK